MNYKKLVRFCIIALLVIIKIISILIPLLRGIADGLIIGMLLLIMLENVPVGKTNCI